MPEAAGGCLLHNRVRARYDEYTSEKGWVWLMKRHRQVSAWNSSHFAHRKNRSRRGLVCGLLEGLEQRRLLSGDPPVAVDDAFGGLEDTPLSVDVAGLLGKGVLANDTDGESDPLTAVKVTDPANGTLALNADGSFLYTPNANFNGVDTFTYQANDGTGDSNVATVTITITAVNDVPSFTKGADETVLEDAGAQTAAGWATAMSAGPANEAAQVLDFIVTNDNNPLFAAQPAINAASGDLTYTLAGDANGVAIVTVRLHDDGGTADGGVDTSAAQTFTITVTAVNDVPSFTKGADQMVLRNAGAQTVAGWATTISAGPVDEATQALDFIVSTDNDALFSVLPGIDPATGNLTFTPAVDLVGSALVTVQLHDDGGTANGGVDTTAAQTFTISVIDANQAPSFTKGADQSVLEDAAAQTVAGWATAISPGPPAEVAQVLNFIVTNDKNAMFGVQPAINAATGNLTYTLAANANGVGTVTVQLHDDGGTALGGVDTSAAQTFTITVTAVNDVPSFTKGANPTVVEDAAAQTVAGWATGISAGPADESAQVLNFIVTNNKNAMFSVQPAINAATGDLTYTLAANANGVATVTVQLHDNGGIANGGVDTSAAQTFTITVTGVNDAPVANDDDYTVNEDTPRTISGPGILANDTDADGNALSAVVVAEPAHGTLALGADGSFTYTPDANYNGSDSFTYKVNDGTANSNTATVTIDVTSVSDVPVARKLRMKTAPGGSARFKVVARAINVDSDPLTITLLSDPKHGWAAVDDNGTPSNPSDDVIVYEPNPGSYSSDSFWYELSDGHGGKSMARAIVRVRGAGLMADSQGLAADLVVVGTKGNDVILLQRAENRGVSVIVNGESLGVFNPSGRVIADGLVGDDVIDASAMPRRVWLYGGYGRDRLIGGVSRDVLTGGPDRDTLVGGGGRDDFGGASQIDTMID